VAVRERLFRKARVGRRQLTHNSPVRERLVRGFDF